MNKLFYRLALALALSLPLLVFAQPNGEPAPVRPLRYESAFADYKPWQDVKAGDWRRLNDNLATAAGTAGGHAGHDSSAPAAPATSPASVPPAPARQGHHKHGGQQ